MDEDALRKIAEISGGKFFRAKDTDSMSSVYKIINSMEKSTLGTHKLENFTEYFMWLVYPALFFLGLEIALSHTKRWRKLP
jgi:Ca-activated chloride channel family protein